MAIRLFVLGLVSSLLGYVCYIWIDLDLIHRGLTGFWVSAVVFLAAFLVVAYSLFRGHE